MNFRSKERILKDIKQLVHSKGYVYALCMVLYEDFFHNLDKIHHVNHRIRLSIKECSLLIGLLVQDEIDFTIPDTPETIIDFKKKTYELMNELHYSINAPQTELIKDLVEKQINEQNLSQGSTKKIDRLSQDGAMVEAIFYAGDGVYDFQYLEYLDRKYKYDKDWLLENKNFDIEIVSNLTKEIKAILQKKSTKLTQLDIKDTFPEIAEKASKKLRKQHSQEEIEEITKQQYTIATFYQYRNLFPNTYDIEKVEKHDWEIFYNNLLNLFVIQEVDFSNKDNIRGFFENFSFIPSAVINKGYNGPGYFNILNTKPLININNGKYFIPINYLVAEAVYETPFYWMYEDKTYLNKASKHRGDVGEEIAYDFLSKIFGIENTYKSVLVTTKKGQPETDIDVLCTLGNKALCVQIKSKKLTINAKRGDAAQLSKDFQGAIQDAYDQGLVSRSSIMESRAKFTDSDGNEIRLNHNINEVYIMVITTENYPGLVHQVRTLLSKQENDPFPLTLSIFDLELLCHYLTDPYDFLYYIRQRIDLMEYFMADDELGFLGYHLNSKLWKDERYAHCYIDPVFAGHIDRNYYPYKIGMSSLVSKKNDPILNRWKDPKFDYLAKVIKESNHSHTPDIIFNLLDLSGETRNFIVEKIINTKKQSRKEQSDKSIATCIDTQFGLSYQTIKNTNYEELNDKTHIYSTLKKYQQKCKSWLGLGSFSNSPNLVDFLVYFDEPWVFDLELEAACEDFSKSVKINTTHIKSTLSIGRNDPCPCKSGLKYKKCCGKN